MELGSAEMKGCGAEWRKLTGHFLSSGTTDRAVFELTAKGKGAVWVDKLSLMPDDNLNGWRKDVVEAVRAWHPGVIRFGGSLQEFGYRWSQGVEPRERRLPFHNQYWGRWDTNDVGIGEFISFCRLVGAEPLICASWQDGPQSAHDLAEFCNGSVATPWGAKRAEWGHAEPYRVRYWQVGNEQWGDEYDKACGTYCQAIRDAAPDAIIVASDNTPMLLQKQGAFISYVCRHYYNMGDYDWCEAQLKEDRAVVEQSGLARPPKLSITEWNVSAADWGLGRLRQVTLQTGLANARFLSFMQRNSDIIGLACRSNMANSFLSGTIQTRMGQVLKTPAYLMLRMYNELSLPVPVRVSGSDWLDMSGCRSEDGTDLTVFLVNTKDQPVQVRLDLGAYPGMRVVAARAVGDKEDRRAPDIVNHWSAPDLISEFPLEVQGETIVVPAYSAAAIQARSGAKG